MSITSEQKLKIIKEHSQNTNDTGSVEVQCALFTNRIQYLIKHLNSNNKDFSSRRGLLMLVGRRRRLLTYLKKTSLVRYINLIKKLNLKK